MFRVRRRDAQRADIGCRVVAPVFNRLPEALDGAFAEVDFVHVCVDAAQDDGLTQQVSRYFAAGSSHTQRLPHTTPHPLRFSHCSGVCTVRGAQVFDEAYVPLNAVPTFGFYSGCLELRKWRLAGADVAEVMKRLQRIIANDRLDDGPDPEEAR